MAIVGAAIWAIVWIDRSDSPRAGRLRHLLGGRERKRRRPGEKRFFWPGEDRALRHAAANHSLLYVDASALHLPPFLITAETAAHKLLFADRDIDFEDDAEFSSRFHVQSSDEPAMRELLNSEVRAEFVAVGNCRIECVGSKLVFTEQQQTTVAGFEDFVEESVRLLKAMGGRWNHVRQFRQ